MNKKKQIKDACVMCLMQFLNWGISTISWRAVSQANIKASIVTDFTLASLNFFIFRKMIKDTEENHFFIPWLGYTLGGVLGTIGGIYFSLFFLGK